MNSSEAVEWLKLIDKYGVSIVVLVILMAFCWILFKTILKQQKEMVNILAKNQKDTSDLLTDVVERNTRAADRNTNAMSLISRVVEKCSWNQ